MASSAAHPCPSCDRDFGTERGMHIHHTTTHGESLTTYTRGCVVCGDEFTQYKCISDSQRACSRECAGELISETKSQGETETCRWCDAEVPIQPWEREWKDYWFCDMDCKAAWQSENVRGEDHPSWRGGWEDYYGETWNQMREKARRRDDYECRVCGDGEDEIGTLPHVHHIEPVRTFDDPNDAHYMKNLITLCPDHHHEAERDGVEVEWL